MNEHSILILREYDRIDGYCAYHSPIKKITLGAPTRLENQSMSIAAQIWEEKEDGERKVYAELPIHQILDLAIFLSRSLLYFRETAYRFPDLYQPDHPLIDRLGVQGDAASLEICTDNPCLKADIQHFSNAISRLGELTGERLQLLGSILKEMQY